eukprot:s1190_g13.t1
MASCSNERILSVGTIQSKIALQAGEKASDKNVELGSALASSLQMQLMALYYDRLFRAKNPEKFRQILDLRFGQQPLWIGMEAASKKAVTPSSMSAEAKVVMNAISKETVDDVKQNKNNFYKFLETEPCPTVAEKKVSCVKTHGVGFFEELVNKLDDAFRTSHEPAIDDDKTAMAAFSQPMLLKGASDLFHIAKVLPASISFGHTVSKCLPVLLTLRQTMLAVEKDCNLGTFEAAFKAIANIRVCAEFAELDSDIQKIQQLLPPPSESGGEASDPASLLPKFLEIAKKLKSLQSISDQKDHAWVTYLSKHGNVKELLFLDTSIKAAMSVKADGLLRAIEVADKWMDPSSGMDATLQLAEGNVDISKDQVKEYILRFLQVKSVDIDQLERAGFDKASDMRQRMWEYMNKVLGKISVTMDKLKADVKMVVKYEGVIEVTTKWDESAMQKYLKMDSEKDVKALAAGGVKIRELEDTIACVLQIFGEDGAKGDAILTKSLANVQNTASTPPTSKTCLSTVACMCGLDIFASAATDSAAKFAEKVPKYYSYCSTELRLIKRDLPKPLVQKVDKCLQDMRCQAESEDERDATADPSVEQCYPPRREEANV